MQGDDHDGEVAVVGMSCRFPGADDPAAFWRNLCAGVESVAFFPGDGPRDPAWVPAHAALDRPYAFDAGFFGVSRREAQVMDPQQRVFLECAWAALEDAGIDPARTEDAIGVFGGSGSNLHLAKVLANPELAAAVGEAAWFANKADFLTTRVSYKLGLRGPSVAVQTACSTSLVAIHLACQSLLNHESDVALAGGVSLVAEPSGYRYQEGGILSPDGHCRAFDRDAAGTVGGSGAGVVVLKRMADALRDGDCIRAVVRGSAINNDGAGKVGFTAPGVRGQAEAIAEALAVAGVDASTVTYVEAHGTGTPLGDPIEIAALADALGADRRGAVALGAVKTNVGHLDTAAGVAGFIKTVLALQHRMLPPTLHFRSANPELGLDPSPFFVNTELRPWASEDGPRRAGVSSFGIGGTNAHVVLEQAPRPAPSTPTDAAQLLVLSARSEDALGRMRARLAAHLAENADLPLANVAHTLQEGRAAHPHRWAAAARGLDQARQALAGAGAGRRAAPRPPVAFLFPGGGTQYPGMARELYAREPLFRAEVDACADAVCGELGVDLRALLFPDAAGEEAARERLERIPFALPALFAVEHALARLWMSWGVRPDAMLGHSMGEYVAACLAGVFTRESAIRLVAARARLMQSAPGGAMLAVPLPEQELRPLLTERLALAAVNSASHCVVSGETAQVGEMEAMLAARGVVARRLHVSVASHSAAMEPILEAFAAEVRAARPAAPQLPFLSNVTGDWITAEQATDPGYWVRHLRQTVRFADGVRRLLERPDLVLLEVGPGEALSTFARRDGGGEGRVVVRSLPSAGHPGAADLTVLEALGALWTAGVEVDWRAARGGEARRRVPLPTYPFDRTEYRVPPPPARVRAAALAPVATAAAPASVPPTNPAMPTTVAPTPVARVQRIRARAAEVFARLLGTAAESLDPARTFLELGADSLLLMQASRTLESAFGVRIPFRRLLEGLDHLDALAAHLDRELVAGVALPGDPAPPAQAPATDPDAAPVMAPAVPAASGGGGPAEAPGVRELLARQLDVLQAVMREQLELLRGGGVAAAANPSLVLPPSGTDAAANGSNGAHASSGAHAPTAAAASSASTGSGAAPPRAADSAALAAPSSADTRAGVAKELAIHGPHRPVRQTLGQGGGYGERQARHFEAFVREYNARTRRSREYAAENRPWLADNRAAMGFRLATKRLLYPIVGERSDGSRIWDLDGNEYVDFTSGFGVHFFGHRPAFVIQAVEEQLRRGVHLGPQSDLAGPAARLLRELAGVERVTFANTGSDAMALAVRIARTATGRDRVVMFEGSYHGGFDGVLARGAGMRDGRPRTLPVAPGTPQGMVDDVVVLPYGTPESLAWLRANASTLAAVLVEPVQSRNPEFHPHDFVREVREITAGSGAVLVFDEMITGLRLGVRGAQELFGVTADLVTYGKVIGGGFPLGVVAGRADLMDAVDGGQWSFDDDSYPAADQTFFAGTFCKHPLAMAAACAVLRHLGERGPALYDELNARAARLVARLRQVIAREGAPVRILHCASIFHFRVDPREPLADLLFHHMVLRGMYIWEGRGCFLSTAHTDDDCDRLVRALEDSLSALREGGFLAERPESGGGAPGGGEAAAVPAGLKLFPAPAPASDGAPRAFPLTPAQRQIWVHAQLGDDASRAYHEQALLTFPGGVDARALRAALGDVMQHHEALRTVFDPSGQAQHVLDSLGADVRVAEAERTDAEGLERAMREAAVQPFDLRAGPLLRAHVHPRVNDGQAVQVVFHHLAMDGLGVAVMLRDLKAAYADRARGRAPRLAPAMQFSRYAALLAAEAERHAGAEAAWLERFRGAAPLVLPTDRPRPLFPTHRGGRSVLALDPALTAALRELGRREGCTLHMVLLAGLLATLHRLAGQDDLVIGIPSAGRPFPGADTLVGHCVDVLPLRSRLDRQTALRPFLRQVRGGLLDAYEHETLSLARLSEALDVPRGPGIPPLVSVVFNLEPGRADAPPSGAGDAVRAPALFSKFDLGIDAVETGGGVELVCARNAGLFDAATVDRVLGRLRRVLEQMAGGFAAPLAALELMDPAERRRVVEEWNATDAEYPAHRAIHQLFEAQAERTPDAPALRADGQTVGYRALNERANRLAHHLAALGVGPETRVGICMERGVEMIVSLLAVLKAGGAYVPLDPASPAQRLAFVLADAAVPVLLAADGVAPELPAGAEVRVVRVDAERQAIAARPAHNPGRGAGPESLAYVVYTSGSTGAPKGVMVAHRGVPNLAQAQARRFGIGAKSRVLQFASPSFDAAVSEVFATLLAGATLVLAGRDGLLPGPGLLRTLRRERVSVVTLPPSLLAVLPPDALPDLRTVVSAGEAVDAATVRRWGQGRRFVNAYGPTETTVCASSGVCDPDDGRPPSIGRPLDNLRTYVLDAEGRPAPAGVPGELFVGGAGVARGYLGRPALTAQRFVPDPFGPVPGARLYRTGDRARWRMDGELEFLGRVDAQVKVRGFRIEPGEVEAALRRHPAVADCAVAARRDDAGDTRLVAYVVGDADPGELRAHLRTLLPDYMVPGAIVPLAALPLNAHGKLDRAALPAPVFGAREGRQAPRTPVEEVLAGIWAQVLRVDDVGVRDGFFALGGHSLLATRVVSRVREVLGVELSLRALFEAPTVAELAEEIEALRRADRPVLPPPVPLERGGPLPLSFAQERLWFLDRLEPGSAFYNLPAALRLRGALDVDALERALGEIVRRHESLRTTFAEVEGAPVQVIAPFDGFVLPVEALPGLGDDQREDHARRLATAEAVRPFDLARGPLFRARLLRLDHDDHLLLLALHHVVSDGWSMGVLFRELAALYAAFRQGAESPLAEPPLQYADFAVWQRQQLRGESLDAQLAWWKARLAGAPALLDLPADHPRPAVHSYRGGVAPVRMAGGLPARLRALARREGATPFMVVLAAFQVLLSKYAGTDDVVVGTPVAGRTTRPVEELIGFFVNTLVLRTDLSGDPTFREVTRRVREATLGAYEHQDLPFEKLVEELHPERSLSHAPLFQVLFALGDAAEPAGALPGLEVRGVGAEGAVARFDLALDLALGADTLAGALAYSTDLFEGDTARRMGEHLGRLLEQAVDDPDLPLSRLALAGADERRMLLEEWNRTGRPFPRGVTIHGVFEAQVRARPGAAALSWGGVETTYAELDARANRLAHHLGSLGVGPESRVGVLLERGPELVVALVAVLKAGGCYLPLDPGYPAERLELMLADAGARVLVTRGALAPERVQTRRHVVRMDEARDALAALPSHAPRSGATPHNLAYVVYTSGSTGRPKGVMVAHQEVVQLVCETDYVALGPGDRVAQASSASFDALTFEAWGALLNGATLVGIPRDVLLSPPALHRALREERVTTLYLTTALLNQLSRERPDLFSSLREVLFGGQQVDADSVRRILRGGKPRRLLHMYGPTETTAWCSYEDVRQVADDALTVTVGTPTGNQRIYVLDAALQPTPVGVPGEAYVGGAGIVRGYLDRPALTAERFVPDPFSPRPGARMYRTGDRLRWKADGRLEFVGRLDFQVKIRGFRIEPGEVESALSAHAGVREARVVVREDAPGERRLVAYVVGDAGAAELRESLRGTLPGYMLPAAFVPLDALPLTPGGKLDTKALPAPEYAPGEHRYAPPRTPLEEVVAATWAQVLGVERVGTADNFFEIGGHSLLATRVVSRLRQAVGVELPLRTLFEAPTVAGVARAAEALLRAGAAPLPPVVPVERTSAPPLSFAQERLWVLERLGQGGPAYNISDALRLGGALDAAALERALGDIVRRHEALRTTFAEVEGAPVQVIHPFAGFALPVEDLSALDAEAREAEAARRAREDAAAPFDLAADAPFRARLLRLGGEDHLLLLSLHHAAGDGWSLGVLYRELWALYEAYRDGGEALLPPLPVQYADFASWQREQLRGEALERQVAWWTERLAGAPELLELPADHPRPAVQSSRGAAEPVVLSAALLERLRAVGRREGATLYMVVLGAFQLLLCRWTGTDDVVVGTTIAGRRRAELEPLAGLFMNTLALRTDLSGDPSFAEVLRRVCEVTLGAYEHQDVPFEKLVAELRPERSLGWSPLFQVLFELHEGGAAADGPAGLRVRDGGAEPETAKYDLALALAASPAGLAGAVTYATDLFERATARRLVEHLRRVLEQVAADPGVRVSEVELLGAEERRAVVEAWNATDAAYPADRCIHQLFAEQAARTPEAPAVLFGDQSICFRELDARANRLAHHLRAMGVGPEVRVGVCMERAPELLEAILAVLKAGGAWVPMDPAHPAERLAYVLDDSAAAVLLAQDRLRGRVPLPGGVRVVAVDAEAEAERIAAHPSGAPESGVTAGNLCYVIYTSGSTGRPKGVAMHHRGVVNYLHWGIVAYGADAGNGAPVFTSMAVDLTITNLLPLFAGRPVRLLPEDNPVEALAGVLRGGPGFGLIKITPVHLALLNELLPPETMAGAAHTLVIGADFLAAEATLPWQENAPGVRLMNEYGPTETVVGCSAYTLPPGLHRAGPVPVGGPIQNLRFYVLDRWLRPVPVGLPGELYIGGAGVARGYLGRPALSAEKFVPDPFAGAGKRMYRSGDRARWLAGGDLLVLGRTDGQVKVRGFRVETGEVEAALRRHPAVSAALVVAREDRPGERRLVAYVVGAADGDELRGHLRRALPGHMVPAAFVRLDALPRTVTGKIDPKTLPAPELAQAGERVAPRTPAEETLAAVWAEVLRLDAVGVTENFFALGGDSILALHVASRARRAGLELSPRQVFEYQTVAELAAVAATRGQADEVPAEDGAEEGTVALTPVQARFFAQDHPRPGHYNQSALLAVAEPVDDGALRAAVAAVLDHHDAPRLRFRRTEAGWEQWYAPEAGIALERIDLSELPAGEQDRAQDAAAGMRQAGLDLERGPVGAAVLFDRGGRGRVLLLVLHHLVVDAVSWGILAGDLERALARTQAGEAVEPGPRGTSFRQWSRALEAYAVGDAVRAEAAHWLAQGPDGVPALPRDGRGEPVTGNARTVSVALDPDETRALLQEVPAAYRTQVNDVLLCALAQAVGEWTGAERVRLALEGHGREETVAPDLDLTRTVGWFTSVYPVVLDTAGAAGPGDRLRRVKEQLRAVPARGIGYGVLRWLGADAGVRQALAAQPEPEILFNYLGQAGTTAEGPSRAPRLRLATGPRGAEWAVENRRAHLLEINGSVQGGRLRLEWTYGQGTHRRETIEAVAAAYLRALRGLIAHCRQAGAGGCTPSDFPLAGLAQAQLDAALAGAAGVEDLYPLSPMQEGMLFHALAGGQAQAYQVQRAYRLEGALDAALFQRAWAEVAARHGIVRTSFVWEGVPRPLQRVHASARVPWRTEDWRGMADDAQESALRRFLDDDRAGGFDLRTAPLMRCALLRVADDAHWFVWSQHHLLMDGWACFRVLGEAFRLYEGWSAGRQVRLGPVRPYRDYIAWLLRQDYGAAERHWRRELAGYTAPAPLGVEAPPGAAPGGRDKREATLSAELTRRLEGLARGRRVTLNTVLLGAWGVLLSRYGGGGDVVLGTTVSGREAALEGVEDMVGLFINTLPVRLRLRGGQPLGEWLGKLQRSQARARQFEYAPLVQVQRWSEVPAGVPLFEAHFIFENFPIERGGGAAASSSRLRVAEGRGIEWNSYPLSLLVGPGRELLLSLSYDQSRFGGQTAARMLEQMERVLEQMAGDPGAPLGSLGLIGPAERARVVEEWNRTGAPFPADRCIHQLFAEQAARTPDAVAVVCEDQSVTFGELDARANRLAHHLRGVGIGPEVRVGVCLERGPELMTALLGVLKAGGAYVPLDRAYPAERLAYMLEDSAVPVLVTHERLRDVLPAPAGVRVVSVDGEWDRIARHPGGAPETGVSAQNLCYVIYTSGSTGRPKGVAMHHRGVANYVHWGIRHYGADAGNGAPVFTSMAVDLTITNLLPLFAGHPVRLLPEENPVEGLAAVLRTGPGFGLIKITPIHLGLLNTLLQPEQLAAAARTLVIGADFLSAEPTVPWQEHAPGVRLMNEYGPTETVVGCSAYTLPGGVHRAGPVPVGGPIQNLAFYVLDPWLHPVPVGVPGELYIGGVGVARGYLGRPALSAEKFVPDPFAGGGARMYRTGDRARWLEGGTLTILGRTDNQVKVRGYRVELGEVEAVVRRHPSVAECLAVVREDRPGDRRLVAYVVGGADGEELARHARGALPEYMVPSAFVVLDALPQTPTGKLDRRALPAPEYGSREAYEPPRTEVEQALAALWTEILGVDAVGAGDDFFQLGGQSLLVMRLTAAAQGAFGVDLSIRAVFAAPTLRQMAAEIERRIYEEVMAMEEAEAEQLAELNPLTGD